MLIGLGNGSIDIAANVLIVDLNRDRLAAALNYLHVLFGVGALMGPIIVGFALARLIPYWWVFCAGAAASSADRDRAGYYSDNPGARPGDAERRLPAVTRPSADLGDRRHSVSVHRRRDGNRRVALPVSADGGRTRRDCRSLAACRSTGSA